MGEPHVVVHMPPRQHGSGLYATHPQGAPTTPALARESAVMYCGAALLAIVHMVQLRSHARAGHAGTWPTATQSVSTVQDWS